MRIAIVGAGLGGIAAGVKLKRAGIETFTVFDKAAGPGGVWWQNTYPGCEVDIPSHAYSFSFMRYDWSGTHASRSELQRYTEDVIDWFGLRSHFRFNTEVSAVLWDETRRCYQVRLADGTETEADVVVSAVGMLSNPRIPTWPGLRDFNGPVFHTSRYDHSVDLTDKRVALVGTGSSACQLGPLIAPVVAHLDVYQREPGHVLAKKNQHFSNEHRARYLRRPMLWRLERAKQFRAARRTADALRLGTDGNQRMESMFRRHLGRTVHDPVTRQRLTPNYAYGCKRPVFASGWFPMFNRPNVELVPHAVTRVTADGIVDDTGTERPADVLILSTGFRADDYLATLPVRGRDGRWLAEEWHGEPWGFLGLTVPGFPNFLMMYGPNTNGGFSVMTQHEIQADALVRVVRRLRRGGGRPIDTRRGLATRVDRWIQQQITVRMSALTAGCHNYFHAATGKNVTQWPFSHTAYRLATRILLPLGLTHRRAGPDNASLSSASEGEPSFSP